MEVLHTGIGCRPVHRRTTIRQSSISRYTTVSKSSLKEVDGLSVQGTSRKQNEDRLLIEVSAWVGRTVVGH